MLNRTLTMQLLLTAVAVALWLVYLGGCALLARKGAVAAQRFSTVCYALLTSYALAQTCFVVYAWINRAPFPLNLETMELLKLQHVKRLLADPRSMSSLRLVLFPWFTTHLLLRRDPLHLDVRS